MAEADVGAWQADLNARLGVALTVDGDFGPATLDASRRLLTGAPTSKRPDLYVVALRCLGIAELSQPGKDHPLIQFMLSLCGLSKDSPDEVPWCSAAVNYWCWTLGIQRSCSAIARSWLTVGRSIELIDAEAGDVVVFERGAPPSGHVALYSGRSGSDIFALGGNQGNMVSHAVYPGSRLIGVRRVA